MIRTTCRAALLALISVLLLISTTSPVEAAGCSCNCTRARALDAQASMRDEWGRPVARSAHKRTRPAHKRTSTRRARQSMASIDRPNGAGQVCNLRGLSKDLSRLDGELRTLWSAYRRVPLSTEASEVRQDDENEFLQKRAACGCAEPCLRFAYRAQINALKNDIERAKDASSDEGGLRSNTATAAQPESPLPAPVKAFIRGYADRCRQLSGELATGVSRPDIITGDLDHDGKPDYVLNPENLRCNAVATAFCANAGCEITIAVSRNGYRNPTTIIGGQPTLSKGNLDVWVDRSNCDITDRQKACWATYSWRGGQMHKAFHTRPSPSKPSSS